MRPRKGANRRGLPFDLPKGYSWQDRLCKSCEFCIDGDCRESPRALDGTSMAILVL